MKIKPYVNKLHGSKEFKDFSRKHSDAFVIAGFFILDLENKKNIHQIDYYVPSTKKVAAFTLDGGVNMQMLSLMNSKVPGKLDIATNVDLDSLHGIVEDEMKNRSITDEVKKIIAVLQNVDGKKVWNLNCVLSGMGILRAHIDDDSKTVLKMEKASLLDYIKRVNPADLQAGMQGKMVGQQLQEGQQAQAGQQMQMIPQQEVIQESGNGKKLSKKDVQKQVDEQLKKLNQLEEAIESEKKRLQKDSSVKDSGKAVSKVVKFKKK